MRTRSCWSWALGLGLWCVASGAALASPRDFVVGRAGTGGTPEQAAGYIEVFLRHAEAKLGWPAGGGVGKFFADRQGAAEYIAASKPGFGMLDPYLWLELRGKESIEVMATVHGPNVTLGHYSVVVQDPAYKTLEDLKGKILISNHLQSPLFLSKVAFDGKLDVGTHFQLQPTGSPLKGLKAVDRGEAAATLVDDRQLEQMKTLPFAQGLRVLYTSPALPPMPVVVFTRNATAADRAKMTELLLTMCDEAPKGVEVCKSLEVTKFSAPDKAVYEEAVRRFERSAAPGQDKAGKPGRPGKKASKQKK